MNDTKLITGKCTECGEPITPANNQVQFNRNRGLHMKSRHGIPGAGKAISTRLARAAYETRAEQQGHWAGKPLKMDAVSVAKREYQKQWREHNKPGKRAVLASKRANLDKARKARWDAHRARQNGQAAPADNGAIAGTQAVPCQLPECPVCHSRFYVVRGS